MYFKILGFLAIANLCAAKHIKHESSNLRIIDGNPVPEHAAPWVVFIDIKVKNKSNVHCTGTLISEKHVLTAAHCVKGSRTVNSVLAGAYSRKDVEASQQLLQAERILRHEQYNASKFNYDIAIIKLKTPAILDEYVKVVNLASASDANETYDNQYLSLYGWGVWYDDEFDNRYEANVLQYTKLPVMSNELCKQKAPNKDVYEGEMCTKSIMRKNICDGDSGGPLMLDNVQVGVISRLVSANCMGYFPSVHIKVGYYRNWIDRTMKNN